MLNLLNRFKKTCVNFIVDHPKRSMTLALLPVLFLIAFIPKLEEEYSVRMWFRTTDEHLIELDQFEKQFGNDQVIYLGIKAKNEQGIFTPQNIKLVHELTDRLWKLTDVIRVESLTNYNYVSVKGDNLSVDPYIPEDADLSEENLNKLKEIAVKHQNIANRFIDKKGKITLIHAQLAPKIGQKESNYQQITQEMKDLAAEYKRDGVEFLLLGSAPVNDAFREVANRDLVVLTPLSMLVISVILFIVLRTVGGTLVSMGAIFLLILACFGFAGLVGIKFNNMTSAIPAIILAIGLAEIMHVLVVYYRYCDEGLNRIEAMRNSLDKNFYATFLTSITTAFGFVGQIFTELTPISDLGILAALGTTAAWILSLFFIAPTVMLLPYKSIDRSFMDIRLFKNPALFVDWVFKHYKFINFFVLITLSLAIWFALKLEVNSETFSYFKENYPIKRDNDLILKEFNGLSGPQIVVQSGVSEGVNDPEFLKKVEAFELWIEKLPYVNQVVSVLDVIRDLSQNLHGGDPIYYRLPETRKEIAEALFLYSLSLPAGMDLNNLVTLNQEDLRLSVFWSLMDSKNSLEQIDIIEKKGKELGLKLYVSGKFFLYNRMNSYVVDTFNSSNIWAVLLIGGIMMALFKSFELGLLSLIPNVVPLIYGMGLLSAIGGTLDVGTSLITSVCFGITVDDTIHFLLHYQSLREKGTSLRDSLVEIYDITAPALVFTTLLLVCGFGVFAFGQFVPNIYFGVLCALILLLGVVLELLFTPALLVALEKVGHFKRGLLSQKNERQ